MIICMSKYTSKLSKRNLFLPTFALTDVGGYFSRKLCALLWWDLDLFGSSLNFFVPFLVSESTFFSSNIELDGFSYKS